VHITCNAAIVHCTKHLTAMEAYIHRARGNACIMGVTFCLDKIAAASLYVFKPFLSRDLFLSFYSLENYC